MLAKPNLKLVPPTGENRAVAPGRKPNSKYRKHEHLTPAEVAKLIEAAKGNRYGQRDATMILVPTGMACDPQKFATWNGQLSTSPGPRCTSAVGRVASRLRTRSGVMSFAS